MSNQDQAVNLEIVSKITVKTLDAQPKRLSVTQYTPLCAIYGRCTSFEAGQSDHGEYVKFKGEFEGVNLTTGKTYRSAVLIMPKVLEDLLHQAINLENAGSVDFAVRITAKPNEKSITGYSYGVEPLIQPAESDALKALRSTAMAQVQLGISHQPETVLDIEAEVVDVTPKAKK